MNTREERAAKNEATARELNEQIERAHLEGDSPASRPAPMVCECAYTSCEQTVMLTADEYAELRTDPLQFAVVADHVIDDLERVVSQNERFVVVAKRDGGAADVAIERDPRE